MTSEDTILAFAGSVFKSVWALDLLLVLKNDPTRTWDAAELIRELRSSQVVVADGLANLLTAGLIVEQEAGRYCYRPISAEIDAMVSELQKLYAIKPTVLIREIVMTPNRKLRQLSDAFRFKK